MTPDGFQIDGGKKLEFVFAKRNDHRLFNRWVKSANPGSNPNVLNAMELATLAFRRWKEAHKEGQVAHSVQDIKDYIRNNPHEEITILILVRARWLKDRTLAGLCHFRRTWCNNIFIDFLTRHPSLVRKPTTSKIRGVGTALLYFVTSVAAEIEAGAVWGEATQNSAEFYKGAFEKPNIKDLFFLKKKDYTAYVKRIRLDLQAKSEGSK